MKRRLFNLAAAVSLVLCVGFIGMGVRSVGWAERWEYLSGDGRLVMLISKSGRLDVLYIARWNGNQPGLSYYGQPAPFGFGGTDYSRRFLGFGAGTQLNGGQFVNIPYWSLAALAAVPAAVLAASKILRRRRARGGFCPTCGYDLRATPERCPECGTAAAVVPRGAASR